LTSCLRRHAGIWDCLSSQQVVDFVRFKVSEGKTLTEISEMMCDHCLAPDTSSGAGIGCDNMTVLIVAILGGRTKEEWYSWITDRVKQNYGYQTPSTVPQIYAHSRLMAFKARREAQEERDRMRAEREESGSSGYMGAGSAFGGFARALGTAGGITFHPSGISRGHLIFGEDSDEEDSDEDEMDGIEEGRSYFSDTLGIGGPRSPDATSNLKAQLDDFEKEIRDDDVDGDKHQKEGEGEKVDGLGTQDLPEGVLLEAVQRRENLKLTGCIFS
jgi:protein phosphatase 2C family protein 2/3